MRLNTKQFREMCIANGIDRNSVKDVLKYIRLLRLCFYEINKMEVLRFMGYQPVRSGRNFSIGERVAVNKL